MNVKNILFCFISLLLIYSCDKTRLYEEYKEIPKYIWNYNYKPQFEFSIDDTTIPYNIYVNVRNSSNYTYQNLFIFLNIRYPDGKYSRDTIELLLADEKGNWLGEGLGGIWDNRFLIKKGLFFKQKGKYIFEYEQGMRENNLPYIMDVGLRVEKMITAIK